MTTKEAGSKSDCSSESDSCSKDGGNGGGDGIPEYEKVRLYRIAENKARLKALGLPTLSASMQSSIQTSRKKGKGKKKVSAKSKVEDEEYNPYEDDEEGSKSFSSEEDIPKRSLKQKKGKNSFLIKAKHSLPKEDDVNKLDYLDDEVALQQAIALSLGDPLENLDGKSHNFCPKIDLGTASSHRNGKIEGHNCKTTGKQKKRKLKARVQMTEDELVAYFFMFDEVGQGNITVRDLRKVAVDHDFIWTDKEIADMIHCFDSNGDGKLGLDDFRKIVVRCNMLQG